MTAAPVRRALRRSLGQVKYVSPVPPGRARGPVAAVYFQMERDFGMLAPPVALHSPAPGPLAACWLLLRQTLVAPGPAGRPAREAVAAAVSQANACPYCVTVHSAALHGLARERTAAALAGDDQDAIPDPDLRRIVAWARGGGTAGAVPAGRAAELIGVAVTFHYLNRMVNVFLGAGPLPPHVPAALRDPLLHLLGRIMRGSGAASGAGAEPAGAELLPAAALPGDLSWAAGEPGVADAVARAAAAVDRAGARSVPGPVRELVAAELAAWDGAPPALAGGRPDGALAALSPEHRPRGRLALLTALASYRVTRPDIEAVALDDAALIELTSWAAMAAARGMGERLAASTPTPQQSRRS